MRVTRSGDCHQRTGTSLDSTGPECCPDKIGLMRMQEGIGGFNGDLGPRYPSPLNRGYDSILDELRVQHPPSHANEFVGRDNYKHPDVPAQTQRMVAATNGNRFRHLPWQHKQPAARGRN